MRWFPVLLLAALVWPLGVYAADFEYHVVPGCDAAQVELSSAEASLSNGAFTVRF